MTARLAENQGKVNPQVVRSLMDLTLFNADGTFAEKGEPRSQPSRTPT